jgi:hypothetical protein
MYLWTSVLSFGAIAIGFIDGWWVGVVVLGLVVVAVLLTIVPRMRGAVPPPAQGPELP